MFLKKSCLKLELLEIRIAFHAGLFGSQPKERSIREDGRCISGSWRVAAGRFAAGIKRKLADVQGLVSDALYVDSVPACEPCRAEMRACPASQPILEKSRIQP